MQLLLIADGRSPTTRRWVKVVAAQGHEITLITSYPCEPVEGVQADLCMPLAFAALGGSASGAGEAAAGQKSPGHSLIAAFRPVFMAGRYRLGPLTLRYYGPRFRWLAERMKPDLVHALRIPFEGMLAAYTPPGIPVVVSTWGNDLTLHASGSASMAQHTRHALARTDGLVADTGRDARLARNWEYAVEKPALVVPGSGGIDLEVMRSVRAQYDPRRVDALLDGVEPDAPVVVNPRGFRTGSVRNDTFFAAIPLVLERKPDAVFACAAMAGQPEALKQVEKLSLQGKVRLLPRLSQPELWSLFLRASVTVSVSQHDGTPNSLLEALALGCFPVAGDIESIREWITPGINGLLVEPDKPHALAEAILTALDHVELRVCAAEKNARLIAERAEAGIVSEKIEQFYRQLARQP